MMRKDDRKKGGLVGYVRVEPDRLERWRRAYEQRRKRQADLTWSGYLRLAMDRQASEDLT